MRTGSKEASESFARLMQLSHTIRTEVVNEITGLRETVKRLTKENKALETKNYELEKELKKWRK